jgi:hypothetical protein
MDSRGRYLILASAYVSLGISSVVNAIGVSTGVDASKKYVWGGNIGWASAQSEHHNVIVTFDEASGGWLSGHIWAANIGWIVMGDAAGGPYENTSSSDWGVNLAADGSLSGFAWAANVGWINFEQSAIDIASGSFSGYAWGENIGWLSFTDVGPGERMRSMAFDKQDQGTPNFWLAGYHVDEAYDAGDGVPAWQKYVMDVDPTVPGNYLRIESISNEDGAVEVSFAPASPRRYYSLLSRNVLTDPDWRDVPAAKVGDPDGQQVDVLVDNTAETINFYGVAVSLGP